MVFSLTDPGLTNRIFDAFNCRQIGTDASVMVVDYDIDCESAHYTTVMWVCLGLSIIWSVGVPGVLLFLMHRIKHLIPPDDDVERSAWPSSADSDRVQKFNFVLSDYKKKFWYWCVSCTIV